MLKQNKMETIKKNRTDYFSRYPNRAQINFIAFMLTAPQYVRLTRG
jgi:hypothetical protein